MGFILKELPMDIAHLVLMNTADDRCCGTAEAMRLLAKDAGLPLADQLRRAFLWDDTAEGEDTWGDLCELLEGRDRLDGELAAFASAHGIPPYEGEGWDEEALT